MPNYSLLESMTQDWYREKVEAMCLRPNYDNAFIAGYIGIDESEVARIRASMPMPQQSTLALRACDERSLSSGPGPSVMRGTRRLGIAIDRALKRRSLVIG